MELLEALDLEQVSAQDEEVVIHGFMDRYDVCYEEAKEIFEETKKWLWLASKGSESNHPLFIDQPLMIIDEMWHNFILHTKQYYKFCLHNFQKFIHHVPTPKSLKIGSSENETYLDIEEYKEKIEKQYSLIYDHLGPETLLKWYDEMAQKYTPEYIKSIKK